MDRVVVVTDSSATVPADLVRELGIRVVPITLTVNGETFRDGIDITSEQLYRSLRAGKQVPTTSAPSIGDFLRTYIAAAQSASGVVSIHLSPRLSMGPTSVSSEALTRRPAAIFMKCIIAAQLPTGLSLGAGARCGAQGNTADSACHL